jgi:iron complex outermembrane recepter protein
MNRSFAQRRPFIADDNRSNATRNPSGLANLLPLVKLSWVASLTVFLCFAVAVGFSQESASLSGTVKDSTGSSVPNATVELRNDKTAEINKAETGPTGECSFTGLAAGSYTVQVSAPGFGNLVRPVTLTAGQSVNLDLVLAVGTEVESVSVSGEVDPYNVVPVQDTATVFGLPQKVTDIPRSVSETDSATLNLYSARTVNDLVTVVPGSFTGAYFGIAGSVFLRGDIADNYFRGFRRVENRGNYQTPLNASDHIEIMEGPPSPIYGPGRIGGFMNFYPKSARSESAKWLDHGEGSAVVRYGQFSDRDGSIEYGLPYKLDGHRNGAYAYLERKDSQSFYKGAWDKYAVGQIAFDSELSNKWRLAYGLQGYNDQGIQGLGWNRVTQQLIDHGTYLSGSPAIDLSSNGFNIQSTDITPGLLNSFAYQGIQYAFPYYNNAQYYALNPSTVHYVTLPRNQIMVDDSSDFLSALTFTGYFDAVYDIKPGVTFKNQTFYDRMSSQKYSSYGFGADYRPWVVENKSTLNFAWQPGRNLTMNAYAGADYTFVKVSAGEERDDYQVVDRRDLSVGPTANDRFAGPWNSTPRIPFQYLQRGIYDDYGLFWLSDFDFWNRLVFTTGARLDRYSPDFWGRDSGYGALTHEKTQNTGGFYNGSVSYRTPYHLTPYFTAATSHFLDLGQGNEIDYSEIPNGTYVEPSTIYEGGVKSEIGQLFYGALSFYRQKRSQWDSQTDSLDYFRTKGAELELRAFVLRRLTLTGAFTWQEPQELNAPFILGIPPSVLGLTPEQAYGGKFEGVASQIVPQTNPYPVGGQPHWVASPFATFNVTKSIGVLVGTTWVDHVRAGYLSPVILPTYSLWRGSLFYRREKMEFNLSVNNMFDARYFQGQYLFEDSLVKPGEGRSVGGTARYNF